MSLFCANLMYDFSLAGIERVRLTYQTLGEHTLGIQLMGQPCYFLESGVTLRRHNR